MVQIKLEIICGIISQESFISHMVQIKLASLITPICLQAIFISHMVQIKHEYLATKNKLVILYIPHGSDKTPLIIKTPSIHPYFISHMVQIKLLFFDNLI